MPDEDKIRERAYAIWEEDGRPEGRQEEHWYRASTELGSAGLSMDLDHHARRPAGARSRRRERPGAARHGRRPLAGTFCGVAVDFAAARSS